MGQVRDNLQRNLGYYLTLNGMSQKELADKLNVSQSAVTNWIKGKNSPDIEVVAEICSLLDISVVDLLGTNESVNSFSKGEHSIIKKYRNLDSYGKKAINTLLEIEHTRCLDQAQRQELSEELAPYAASKAVSLYELPVSAGTGMLLQDEQFEFINLPPGPTTDKADFALRVSGDSMEPKFYSGDIILVQQTPSVEPNEIGVFVLNGAGYVKRLGEAGQLVSLNPAYPDIVASDGDTLRCLGRVLGKAIKQVY